MKAAFKASNGKYVTAEQGGGLIYGGSHREQVYPGVAPLYANRDTIGAWETFDVHANSAGTINIKCNNGCYWTTELDPKGSNYLGISTNRTEANAWEQFRYSNDTKGIVCADNIHVVTSEQSTDSHMNATRDAVNAWEQFQLVPLEPIKPNWPPVDILRAFKGNFGGLMLNLPYAPNGQLFTPAYVVYDDPTRQRIREAYLENGWFHYPINLTNHSTIYRDFYPQWDDSLINKYLTELLKDGLIPVGYVMGDQDTVVNCKADPSLVPIAIPKWEDTSPIKRPALDSGNTFWLVKQRYPNSLIYWHNPPYQGAPFVNYSDWGLPDNDPGINAKVWRYMVNESFVQGLLFQGKAWENDANDSISVLTSFVDRLKHGVNGWPICDLVDHEETVFYMFNMNGDYNQALAWTKKIRDKFGSELNGYTNG